MAGDAKGRSFVRSDAFQINIKLTHMVQKMRMCARQELPKMIGKKRKKKDQHMLHLRRRRNAAILLYYTILYYDDTMRVALTFICSRISLALHYIEPCT